MAEYAYLTFYKEHPSERMARVNHSSDYSSPPKRQRGVSLCAPALTPVMEEGQEDFQKKAKRRFSLDFMFSKKRRDFKVNGKGKRGSSDSTASLSDDAEETPYQAAVRRASILSIRSSNAEVTAWCFA